MTRRGRRVIAGFVLGGGLVAIGVNLGVDRTPDVSRSGTDPWNEGRVRVEILNVGGVSGMAAQATTTLRAAGFDVVKFGNAVPFDAALVSGVIDRVGRTDIAQAVAEELGIDNVQSDPNPNLYVDVSVLLGSEWSGPNDRPGVDDASGSGAWWDPRGWFGR
ncbi:MAG: LytR C-terminal domain-containing protein [Gemmatimonadetes bacterium]|nr:LytR C-terminal domain-containing protein [Gemmatimonadota bacterium]MDA1102863.1 LytR C-terminal domain-containing protein [Gemmatimonadota bacterium]